MRLYWWLLQEWVSEVLSRLFAVVLLSVSCIISSTTYTTCCITAGSEGPAGDSCDPRDAAAISPRKHCLQSRSNAPAPR